MGLHNDVVCHLEVADESRSIEDFDAELALDGVVDLYAGADVTEAC
jgi:hypothetical protein